MKRSMDFLDRHKGIVSFIAAALCLGVGLVLRATGNRDDGCVLAIGEAALVGAICDWIALHALFHKRWFFPGSGVIPRNRAAITLGLRNMTQRLIEDQLRAEVARIDFKRLLDGLVAPGDDLPREAGPVRAEAARSLGRETVELLMRRITERIRSEEFRAFIAGKVAERAGQVAKLADSLGLFTFRELADQIAKGIESYLEELRTSSESRRAVLGHVKEEVQSFLATEEDQIARKARDRFLEALVPQLARRAGELVERQLESYGDDAIRDLFYQKTGKHLDWIRVNGAFWGGIIGFCFWLFRRLG